MVRRLTCRGRLLDCFAELDKSIFPFSFLVGRCGGDCTIAMDDGDDVAEENCYVLSRNLGFDVCWRGLFGEMEHDNEGVCVEIDGITKTLVNGDGHEQTILVGQFVVVHDAGLFGEGVYEHLFTTSLRCEIPYDWVWTG